MAVAWGKERNMPKMKAENAILWVSEFGFCPGELRKSVLLSVSL